MIDEQRIIGLLQAKALGCLDSEESKELQEFIDAGHLFPWEELGQFQNIASLLPLALQLETPDAELKDRVALKLIKLSEQLRANKILEEDKFEIEEDLDEPVNEFANIDESIVEPPIEIETESSTVVEDNLSLPLNTEDISFNLDEINLPDFQPSEVSENTFQEPVSVESPFDNLVDESQIEYPQVDEVEVSELLTAPDNQKSLIEDSVSLEEINANKPVEDSDDSNKQVDFNKRSVAEKMFKAIEQDFDTLKYHFEESERKITRGLLIAYVVIAVLLASLVFSFFKFSSDINGLKNELKDLKKNNSSSLIKYKSINSDHYYFS